MAGPEGGETAIKLEGKRDAILKGESPKVSRYFSSDLCVQLKTGKGEATNKGGRGP